MGRADIFEVARRAGVSKSTASRVLNGSYGVSADAREKVMKAVSELKYRPNISARYLRSSVNNLIGILISVEKAETGVVHPVNSRKISGIVNKVKELGFDVLIFIEDISDRQRLNRIIKDKGLCGILLLDKVEVGILDSFRECGIPFVLVNWFIPGYEHQCYVKTDLAKAVEMALDLFSSRGYGDIALINWEDVYLGEKTIENAFRHYMSDKGLTDECCVWNTDIHIPKKSLAEFLDSSKKRAYLCFSYYGSIDILDCCRERHISIPGELALISYEFFPFFDYVYPRLTGIRQKAELMGEIAAEKLIRIIHGEPEVKSELIAPEIIMRDTC